MPAWTQRASALIGAVLLLATLAPRAVLAWGALGHETVCTIAYQELTPRTREAIDRIMALESDPQLRRFGPACTWPDRPGDLQSSRRADHYINVPRHWYEVRKARCHETEDCLFSAIEHELNILKSREASGEARLIALKFLGHWLGDIHQPLHVSYRDDRGGNDILLTRDIGCRLKLHDVWDTCIPEELMQSMGVQGDRSTFAQRLQAAITDAQRAAWSSVTQANTWADESYRITRARDTRYCVLIDRVCQYAQDRKIYRPGTPERKLNLTGAYEEAHSEIVKMRLQQAGVRLAGVLEEALGR